MRSSRSEHPAADAEKSELGRTSVTKYLRTLLVLGRVSNLPTVWSNCCAGWLLGGGGSVGRLILLCAGATLLYLSGMFLNDAFDADFDDQHRPERPIPSQAIGIREVWLWGFGWMVSGLALLMPLGYSTAALAILLVVSIIIYDAIHKIFAFSPLLMAACRFFLILLAASASSDGITGISIWSALVMAAYIVGLSYFARKESTGGALSYWPCLFLGCPIVLGLIVNAGPARESALLLTLILSLWIVKCLRHMTAEGQRNVGRAVGGMLAGICLVDLLSVATCSKPEAMVFLCFFGLALVFQRFIPPT